jgi:hypothetical protein
MGVARRRAFGIIQDFPVCEFGAQFPGFQRETMRAAIGEKDLRGYYTAGSHAFTDLWKQVSL